MPVAPTRFEQALLDMYGLDPNDCEEFGPDVTESDDPGVIRDALAEWGEGLGLVRLDRPEDHANRVPLGWALGWGLIDPPLTTT